MEIKYNEFGSDFTRFEYETEPIILGKLEVPEGCVIGTGEGFSYSDVMGASKNDKLDGKPDYSLLPEVFLTQVARAMMAGQVKYGKFNYLKGHNICQLTSAIQRHAKAIEKGEWWDEDTSKRLGQKVSHLACISASCLMALHQDEEGTLKDDTYKGLRR